VVGRQPTFDESRAVAEGWGDTTLGFVRGVTCADPLTGLSSEAHVRAVLADWFQGSAEVRAVLAVIELPTPQDPFAHARRLTLAGQLGQVAFPRARAVGRFGVRRVGILAPREAHLAARTELLFHLLGDLAGRVWVDVLPGSIDSAGWLLDELRY